MGLFFVLQKVAHLWFLPLITHQSHHLVGANRIRPATAAN
jgi:hypothetical protein